MSRLDASREASANGEVVRDWPEVGDIAPDAVLMDTDGRHVHLSASWTDQRAVVVFLRYFGCRF